MMENTCDIPAEDLPFSLFGLCLQEPMALVMNMAIAFTCFWAIRKLRRFHSEFHVYWKYFFFFLGISMFFGAFSHVFFQYTGMYGKIFTWFFAFIAGVIVGKGMLSLDILSPQTKKWLYAILYLKVLILLPLALIKQDFLYVTMDSIITYLLFCLTLSILYLRKGLTSFKYSIWAVILLVPSVIVFIFKINLSVWFNKNDLSHLFMVGTIILFYWSVKEFKEIEVAEHKS